MPLKILVQREKLDKEIPVEPCQELWPEFVAHDKKVMDENRAITAIAIHHYGKVNIDKSVTYLANKYANL